MPDLETLIQEAKRLAKDDNNLQSFQIELFKVLDLTRFKEEVESFWKERVLQDDGDEFGSFERKAPITPYILLGKRKGDHFLLDESTLENYILCHHMLRKGYDHVKNDLPGASPHGILSGLLGFSTGLGWDIYLDPSLRNIHPQTFYDLFFAGYMFLESLHFDLQNLGTSKHSNASFARLLSKMKETGKRPRSHNTFFANNKKAAQEAARIKSLELNSRQDDVKRKVHTAIAIFSYLRNLRYTQSVSTPLLTKIMDEELKISLREGHAHCYCQLDLMGAKASDNFQEAFKLIQSNNDPDQMADFLRLMESSLNPKDLFKVSMTFASLWDQAYKNGWHMQYEDHPRNFDPFLSSQENHELLARQETGALLNLSANQRFREVFKGKILPDLPYETLEELMEADIGIFEQILPDFGKEDARFVQSLVRILNDNGAKISVTKFSKEQKEFIEDAPLTCDSQDLIMIINNFQTAKEALEHGVTPYQGAITKIGDIAGFVQYFAMNLDHINEELTYHKEVERYGLNSQLREDVLKIVRDNGIERSRNYLAKLSDLQGESYARLASLMSKTDPRWFLRSRDLTDIVKTVAQAGSETEWKRLQVSVASAKDEISARQVILSYSDIIEKESPVYTQEVINTQPPPKAHIQAKPLYDPLKFDQDIQTTGYDPQLVRAVLEKGFCLASARRFIGLNYLTFRHVVSNVQNVMGQGMVGNDDIEALLKFFDSQEVIIHHGKNRTIRDGCLSINSHTKHIPLEPLRDYIRELLYGRLIQDKEYKIKK